MDERVSKVPNIPDVPVKKESKMKRVRGEATCDKYPGGALTQQQDINYIRNSCFLKQRP